MTAEKTQILAVLDTHQVLLHLIAETSQHAGHADILRESLGR
jgi:hypothetical protein